MRNWVRGSGHAEMISRTSEPLSAGEKDAGVGFCSDFYKSE